MPPAKKDNRSSSAKKGKKASSSKTRTEGAFDFTLKDDDDEDLVAQYFTKQKKKPLKVDSKSSTPTTKNTTTTSSVSKKKKAKKKEIVDIATNWSPPKRRRRKGPKTVKTEKENTSKEPIAVQPEHRTTTSSTTSSTSPAAKGEEKKENKAADNNLEAYASKDGDHQNKEAACDRVEEPSKTPPHGKDGGDQGAANNNKEGNQQSADSPSKPTLLFGSGTTEQGAHEGKPKGEEGTSTTVIKPATPKAAANPTVATTPTNPTAPTQATPPTPQSASPFGGIKRESFKRRKRPVDVTPHLDPWMPRRRKKSWIGKKVVKVEEKKEDEEKNMEEARKETTARPPIPLGSQSSLAADSARPPNNQSTPSQAAAVAANIGATPITMSNKQQPDQIPSDPEERREFLREVGTTMHLVSPAFPQYKTRSDIPEKLIDVFVDNNIQKDDTEIAKLLRFNQIYAKLPRRNSGTPSPANNSAIAAIRSPNNASHQPLASGSSSSHNNAVSLPPKNNYETASETATTGSAKKAKVQFIRFHQTVDNAADGTVARRPIHTTHSSVKPTPPAAGTTANTNAGPREVHMGNDQWVSRESLVKGVVQQYLAMNQQGASVTTVASSAAAALTDRGTMNNNKPATQAEEAPKPQSQVSGEPLSDNHDITGPAKKAKVQFIQFHQTVDKADATVARRPTHTTTGNHLSSKPTPTTVTSTSAETLTGATDNTKTAPQAETASKPQSHAAAAPLTDASTVLTSAAPLGGTTEHKSNSSPPLPQSAAQTDTVDTSSRNNPTGAPPASMTEVQNPNVSETKDADAEEEETFVTSNTTTAGPTTGDGEMKDAGMDAQEPAAAASAHNSNSSSDSRKRGLDDAYLLYLADCAAAAPSNKSSRKKRSGAKANPTRSSSTRYSLDDDDDNSVIVLDSENESEDGGGGKIGAVRDIQGGSVGVDRQAGTPDEAPSVEVKREDRTSDTSTPRPVKSEKPTPPTNTPDPALSNGDERESPMEEDVEWVATANETRLPHMRQHCLDYKFDLTLEMSLNRKYCDLCYCYVCDILAKDCKSWDMSEHRLQNHCHAHDTNSYAQYWKGRRDAVAKKKSAAEGDEGGDNPQELIRGEGPFDPDDEGAQKDPNLTACRNCKWFNRFFHRNFRHFKNLHPVGFLDWCHKCGRIASENDFGKIQAKPLEPQEGDIFLGTKALPFRISAHDPREMERYEDSWLDADEDDPQWQYDEAEMREDFFRHRFGERPTLSMILASISILNDNDMPSTGSFAAQCNRSHYLPNVGSAAEEGAYDERCGLDGNRFFYWERPDFNDSGKTSVNETEGIHMIREGDLVLLQQIALFEEMGFCKRTRTTTLFQGKKSTLSYGITAKWDKKSSVGTFFVQLYVKPQTGKYMPLQGPASWNKLFGAWFDLFPIALSDISGSLTAELPSEYDDDGWYEYGLGTDQQLAAPPFSISVDEKREAVLDFWPTIERAVEERNSKANTYRRSLCLESTRESKGLGGRSPVEIGFSNVMRRYFGEVLVEDVVKGNRMGGKWVNRSRGITSTHRQMRKAGQGLAADSFQQGGQQHDIHDLCYLKAQDRPLAFCMRDACSSIYDGTTAMSSIITHSENLGHEEIRFVNGLNVELLQFQRQSVQWALERETVDGGVQSWLWPKLPRVVQPRKENVYYNPILETWRIGKPALVRGGIIAEEMGLGKTVESLALILCNPAPEFPVSGCLASDLELLPDDSATWDKDLRARTSADNPKIGRIISRGTLVVCKVSLVGQWIEEAKSKLKDPGLVYPYHGPNRKRDPRVLAQNGIVVTTYETIASDATYHKEKSGSADYVPPLSQVRFWRLICDESHSISQGGTKNSDASMGLVADHKWLVSGTPIQTSLTNLKNQLKFLGIENVNEMFLLFRNTLQHTNDRAAPGSNRIRRRGHLLGSNSGPGRSGNVDIGHFMFFLRAVFLRHSQQQIYRNSNPKVTLMSLPPKTERTVGVDFSAEERLEYQSYEEAALNFYAGFRKQHLKSLSKHFLKLAAKLTQVRIACAGGRVPLEEVEAAEDEEENESENEADVPRKKKAKVAKFSDFVFKSKFDKLFEELKRSRDNDPKSKSLVFSQFTSSLQYLMQELPKHGFQYRTLSGDMPMRRRAKALHDFQNDPPTTIFLLSMRAGAVGINLTQANRVFLLEPCFNPALEAQSVGRVHRLGQTREVQVIRLCMEDSVESRMAEMLKRKYGDNIDSDDDDDEEKGAPEAIEVAKANNTFVGSVTCDKAVVVAAEFDLLFGYQPPEEPTEEPTPANVVSGVLPGEGNDVFYDANEAILPDPVFSFPACASSSQGGCKSGFL